MTSPRSTITWHYVPEEGYYLAMDESVLEDMLMSMFESGIPLPLLRTSDNDADMQALVDILRRIEGRLS